MDLRGNPADVLQRVSSLDLNPAQRKALNSLKSLVELLQTTPDALPSPNSLVLDLSLIRTFDYYTGIVFEVVSEHPSGLQVLGQGGRYDQLLGLYHPQGQSNPGVGFSLQIEQLHQVLLPTGQLPQFIPSSHCLVVPDSPQSYSAALAHAQALRSSLPSQQVELDLGSRTPSEVHDYARHRRISQILWVKAGGEIEIETVS
jgi:ATP phosphoribosyltransferase regulatory subunit